MSSDHPMSYYHPSRVESDDRASAEAARIDAEKAEAAAGAGSGRLPSIKARLRASVRQRAADRRAGRLAARGY